MKRTTLIAVTILFTSLCYGQTVFKEYKVGRPFNISLPDYMSKTVGLNDAAIIQYQSNVKDVYGFVIVDNKEELKVAELYYSSITDFYDYFIKSFGASEKSRTVSKPVTATKGKINFLEAEVTLFNTEANIEIYYLVGIVETEHAFYKIISWSSVHEKDKFRDDFQKIIYSLND